MKSIQENFIQNQIDDCLKLNKKQKNLVLYVKKIIDNEYYVNITISKEAFQSEGYPDYEQIPYNLLFVLHLVHNYPTNPPKLYCLTSLSKAGIEICDAKNILDEVLQKKWNNAIPAKEILIKIIPFLKQCFSNEENKLFIGKYSLDSEYDYNILCKVPHNYLDLAEEIINKRKNLKEKRLLMITNLFFLVFSVKEGYFSYSDIKLVFWASIRSIYGMKQSLNNFTFEFSKTITQRIFIPFITKDGDKIMSIVLDNLKQRNIDYLINQEKTINLNNQTESENKYLPGFSQEEVKRTKSENNIDDINDNLSSKDKSDSTINNSLSNDKENE